MPRLQHFLSASRFAARCASITSEFSWLRGWPHLVVLLLVIGLGVGHPPRLSAQRRPTAQQSQPHRGQARHHSQSAVRAASHADPRYPVANYVQPDEELMVGHAPLPSELNVGDEGYAAPCGQCSALRDACCCQPCGWLLDWSRGEVWVGTNGFSGASSFLGTAAAGQVAGNFGFQQGFNFGGRLPGVMGGQLGSQLGLRFTQTQLDSSSAGDDQRTQAFLTAGLFRRVDYGLQGGLVIDYLHDDWVYQADMLQLRGEVSFLFSPCHDAGFRFSDSQQIDDTRAVIRGLTAPIDLRLEGLNTYRFFYRARLGEAAASLTEFHAGFTEDWAAIFGAHLRTPLHQQLGLELDSVYLLPPEESGLPYTQAGWNLSLALVWSPGRCFGRDRDYYRPLFAVADNGSFIAQQVAP